MAFQLLPVSRNKDHFQLGPICVEAKGGQEINLVKFIPLGNFHH